jgi:hypothetical protein
MTHRGLLAVCLLLSTLPRAQTPAPALPPLVAHTLQNELNALGGPSRFLYHERRAQGAHARTYAIVETDAGALEWLIAYDDRPLDPQALAQEHAWLARLRSQPDIQRKRKEQDDEVLARERKLARVLPAAFFYEPVPSDDPALARFHFRPNPEFRPTSRETNILRRMEGDVWIDIAHARAVRVVARLTGDVSFGWGFAARLDSGGTVRLEQSQVAPGEWRITRMDFVFSGTKAIFFPFDITVHDTESDFHRVAGHLTLAEGLALLEAGARSQ